MMTKSFWTRICRFLATISIALTLVFVSTNANAGDADNEWYGEQIMAADAAAITWVPFVLLLGNLSGDHIDDDYLVPVALAGYALGGPIIHAAHQQWWQASASFGMRVGLPFVGGYIATKLSGTSDLSALGPAFVGGLSGVVTAMAVDYIFLANRPISKQADTAPKTQMLQVQWRF